jgi:hypothetical protein
MNTNTTNTESKKNGQFGADAGLQEKIMKQIHDLGDSLERAGEKVEKNGWEMIGQAIYKLGNSLEHLQDKKVGDKKAVSGVAANKPYSDKEFDDKSKKISDSKVTTSKVGGNDSQAY